MNELTPLIQYVTGHWPHALTVITSAMGLFRVFIKPFSAQLQERFTARMVAAAQSADQEEGRDFDALLQSRWYRWPAFFLDLLLSFKLPTHADFLRAHAKATGNPSGQ